MIELQRAAYQVEDDYDPEVDNIDDILQGSLPQAARFQELQTANRMFNGITREELEDMEDDDEIIDLFLSNPDRFTHCPYFQQGNCRYGDNCRYLHEVSE